MTNSNPDGAFDVAVRCKPNRGQALSERTNHDVVSVPVPERELLGSSIRVRVRLLFEAGDERACPFQCHIEIVDAEEQEEPVARCRIVRARQRRMLVRAPLVEAEQDSSIRIEDLTKVGMARPCLGLGEERLVPFEATRHIAYADDRPNAFHDISPANQDRGFAILERAPRSFNNTTMASHRASPIASLTRI